MITSSASPIASNRLTTERRPSAPIRAERQREQHGEHDQRQDVAVGRGGKDIVGDDALEEVGDPRERRRRFLLDPGERGLEPRGRPARQREQVGQQHDRQRAEDRGCGADDHDPQDRPAAMRPAERGFGAFGDADDEQRDDQRDDGHLERVEPQGADEGGAGEQVAANASRQARRWPHPSARPTSSAASAQ